jgi:protein involved in polysaccharide export with SLBB domain
MRKMLVTAIVLLFAVTGCGEPTVTRHTPVESILPSHIESDAYRIGAGDEIELKFFYTPELNDRMTVRPDGKISVMFLQDVQASGLTAKQLSAALKRKLSAHIKQLDLVIIVRTFASQKVYVSGEVAKPGPIIMTGHEDLLQVMDDAGWITPLASRDRIMLVRRDEEGKDVIYFINFKKIMTGEDMSQNIPLQPGDLILVPPSGVTSANRWVDQSIRQMIPITTGVFVNGR